MSAARTETQAELKEIKIVLKALLYKVERLQNAKRISRRRQNSTPLHDSQLRSEFPDDHETPKGSNA